MVDIPDHFDRNSFFRNILITDEVVVRLGAEPGVAAVEEGGPHGEGRAGLGQAPGVGLPHHPALLPGQSRHLYYYYFRSDNNHDGRHHLTM